MALIDVDVLVLQVTTATQLPQPSTVAGRTHAIINTSTAPVLLTAVAPALPFKVNGVNVASFSLQPATLYIFQAEASDWLLTNQSANRAFFAGTAVTDASGNAVFTFPAGTFSAPPVVDTEIQFPASPNPIDHRITALTATSCTINCKQSPTLIVLSLSVLGVAANISGVTVHLIATPAGVTI